MLEDIRSLDYIKDLIYKTKFSTWLINNYLTALIIKDSWKLKTFEGNIIFELVTKTKINFIKAKFNVGLIHVANEQSIDTVVENVIEYGDKIELVAHLFSEAIKSNDINFIQLTYELNLYQGVNLEELLDLVYEQIEMIKEDIKYRLNLKIIDPEDFRNRNHPDEDLEDEDDEDDEEDQITNPYNLGDR